MKKTNNSEKEWMVFDIDGVLIDVSNSFDLAVKSTLEKLLLKEGKYVNVEKKRIRGLRKRGSFGDDFKLTEALYLAINNEGEDWPCENLPLGEDISWFRKRFPGKVETSEIETIFNNYYLGRGEGEGFWKKEKALIKPEKLKKLEKDYRVGTVTGRNKKELELAESILRYEFSNFVTRDIILKPDYRALDLLVGSDSGIYFGDAAVDEKLVRNHGKHGGNLTFMMIGRDIKNVNKGIKRVREGRKI